MFLQIWSLKRESDLHPQIHIEAIHEVLLSDGPYKDLALPLFMREVVFPAEVDKLVLQRPQTGAVIGLREAG